jgi:SpoVK/Ycf46/Vps4 family AAA+-type ATPase
LSGSLNYKGSERDKWDGLSPCDGRARAAAVLAPPIGSDSRMARADLLKSLFRSHQARDDASFREVASKIIREARRKHHVVLANELERILNNSPSVGTRDQYLRDFEPPPRDADRKTFLAEIRQPDRYLADLVLTDAVRKRIIRVVDEFRNRDVLEVHGLKPTARVLFCGPSGCGKTVTAEAIASELALPLLYVRFDAVVSSLLGETASNLRKVFEYASRGYLVLFFDEFDAIGRSRDDETEHGEIKRLVNSYLQLMDNFHGRSLIIAATNFERSLDFAIWRRFDDVFRFERPSDQEVAQLIRKNLAEAQPNDLMVNKITRSLLGGSHADVERVCLDVRKILVLKGDRDLSELDIDEALERHAYRKALMKVMAEAPSRLVDRE